MADKSKIPDKLTFKQKEVIKLTHLDAKVLDFWEGEFGHIKPAVNKMGEKFYSRQDVIIILQIKEYLIQKRMTREQVRERLDTGSDRPKASPDPGENKGDGVSEKLTRIRQNLVDILTLLDKNGKK